MENGSGVEDVVRIYHELRAALSRCPSSTKIKDGAKQRMNARLKSSLRQSLAPLATFMMDNWKDLPKDASESVEADVHVMICDEKDETEQELEALFQLRSILLNKLNRQIMQIKLLSKQKRTSSQLGKLRFSCNQVHADLKTLNKRIDSLKKTKEKLVKYLKGFGDVKQQQTVTTIDPSTQRNLSGHEVSRRIQFGAAETTKEIENGIGSLEVYRSVMLKQGECENPELADIVKKILSSDKGYEHKTIAESPSELKSIPIRETLSASTPRSTPFKGLTPVRQYSTKSGKGGFGSELAAIPLFEARTPISTPLRR